jgi:cytochrome b561
MRQPTPMHIYGAAAKALHWSTAALILLDFACAISFSQFNPGDALYLRSAYAMHMSFGLTALLVGVLFVLRRIRFGYHKAAQDIGAPSRALARIVHELLYVFIIVVPVTGWIILSTRNQRASLIGPVNWPNIGFIAALPREQRRWLYDLCFPGHRLLAYFGMSLVALHFLAALYHHFYRRDEVLKRMLPQFLSSRAFKLWSRPNADPHSN